MTDKPRPVLPEGATMAQFQQYVRDLEEFHSWQDAGLLEIMLFLSEEVGELARAVREYVGLRVEGEPPTEEQARVRAAQEITDMVNLLLAIANRMNIDLDDTFRTKNADDLRRVWNTRV